MNRREFSIRLAGGFAAAPFLPASRLVAAETPDVMWAYIGTYTRQKSKGIYALQFNMKTGEVVSRRLAAETESPSFLAIHQNNRFLYAVNEVGSFKGASGGGVSAFSIDRQMGRLTALNDQWSGGGGPCHLVVDKTGKHVLVANYGGGSVSVLPIRSDGSLGKATAFVQHEGSSVNPRRQQGPHAHSINLDPDNRFAAVADLGMDKVMIYKFDAVAGSLTPAKPAFVKARPGGGPRHFAFHPNGRFAYTNLGLFSSVTAFARGRGDGSLKEIQTISTLPEDHKGGNSTAEVQVHPSGRFLYCSNRGHNSIAVFSIDENSGSLNTIQRVSSGGEVPRNFGIDPTGRFLLAANQKTDNVAVFRIDGKTGRLQATGQSIETPTPVCVKFLGAGE